MSVDLTVKDGVAVVTIDRPDVRNCIDRATALAIDSVVQRVNVDEEVRCVVITGAGGNFCAGMDLKAFLRGETVRLPTGFAGLTQAKLEKPFIAAVEGYALAGGFEIALACDIIISAETAKFGLTEVKRGLVANAGGIIRLPRQIPAKIAAELILTGDLFPADRLLHAGLINRIVPAGEALAAALEIAQTIAGNGPMAVAVSRQILNDSRNWTDGEMFERQFELTAPVFASDDAREGALAFAEKRRPVWKGR
ncbi:crotonase/enoyl-CoA hydratase family protein [Sphingomonas bisphenolicum]